MKIEGTVTYPWVNIESIGMINSRLSFRRLGDRHHRTVSTLLSGIVETMRSVGFCMMAMVFVNLGM
jgi:hypothetical protein